MPHKTDQRTRNSIRHKEGHFIMMKWAILQQEGRIINVHALAKGAPKREAKAADLLAVWGRQGTAQDSGHRKIL